MDIGNIVIISMAVIFQANGEYCKGYWDNDNVRHGGFSCPTKIKLIGISDVYCCYSETTPGRRECCSDRTKSLYNADMTYWDEAFIMSYPFLVLFGGCVTLVIVYTSMQPKEAEVKHEIYE